MSEMADRLRALTPPPPGTTMADFAERAFAGGQAEAAYGRAPTPLGEMTAVVTRRGLLTLLFEEQDQDGSLQRVADRVTPAIVESQAAVGFVREALDGYFRGSAFRIEMPLDRRLITPYQGRILNFAYGIPPGEVRTYRQAAERAGNGRAARAAGRALAANPLPVVLPCHRVTASDGGLRGYAGGLERKRFLLEHEGFPR